MSLTFVCLECRKSYRGDGDCPHCGAELWRTDDVPRKHKTREWDALRRRIFRWETCFVHEIYRQTSALDTRYLQARWEGPQELGPRQLRRLERKTAQARKKIRSSLCALNVIT